MNRSRFISPPSPEAHERVSRIAERQMSAEEFDAYVNAPMSEEERQEILESIAWFTKRYPTPGERLQAARHGYQQWTRGRDPVDTERNQNP